MKSITCAVTGGEGGEPTVAYCRDCGVETAVEPLAAALLSVMAGRFRDRDGAPMGLNECVRCGPCAHLWNARERDESLRQLQIAEQLFAAMRTMSDSPRDDKLEWLRGQPRWFRDEHAQSITAWMNRGATGHKTKWGQ